MPHMTPTVTLTDESNDRLPDWAAEGVVLVLDLQRRGQLGALADRARIRRQGGYAGIDVVLFFLYYFAARLSKGVRTFYNDDAQPYAELLGAVGGRTRLPSPAALSRALDAAEYTHTRALGPWLLREAAGVAEVMQHPSARTWDATGQPWHVFDFDPTVHTLRHRALPEGEGLPEGRRRSAETATAGYSGRKRGEVQLRRATLEHAGSSIWLDVQVASGNGDDRAELARALDVTAETVDALGARRDRALVRADGAFGHVPGITAARKRGLAFLSRLTRPNLLEHPEVRQRILQAKWEYVPDSGSGPRRSATDLGVVTVPPGRRVFRADGSPYEPVQVRVVVSRFPFEGDKSRGRGTCQHE